MFLGISLPKKATSQLLKLRKRSNLNYQGSHTDRYVAGRYCTHNAGFILGIQTELFFCFAPFMLFQALMVFIYKSLHWGLRVQNKWFASYIWALCTLEKHLSMHLQPGMGPQRQPHADLVNQSLQVLFGTDTLGNRSNAWNYLSVELSSRIPCLCLEHIIPFTLASVFGFGIFMKKDRSYKDHVVDYNPEFTRWSNLQRTKPWVEWEDIQQNCWCSHCHLKSDGAEGRNTSLRKVRQGYKGKLSASLVMVHCPFPNKPSSAHVCSCPEDKPIRNLLALAPGPCADQWCVWDTDHCKRPRTETWLLNLSRSPATSLWQGQVTADKLRAGI